MIQRMHSVAGSLPAASETLLRLLSRAVRLPFYHKTDAHAGGPDDKGCWSGCCAVDQHGVPTILYTGVRSAPWLPTAFSCDDPSHHCPRQAVPPS